MIPDRCALRRRAECVPSSYHVVQLPPLGGGDPPTIRPTTLGIACVVGGTAALPDAAVPDDLHARIIGEGPDKQFKCREMTATDNHEPGIGKHLFSELIELQRRPRTPDRLGAEPVIVHDRPKRLIE